MTRFILLCLIALGVLASSIAAAHANRTTTGSSSPSCAGVGCEAPLGLAAASALPKLWPGSTGPFQLRPRIVDYANGHAIIAGPGGSVSDPNPIRWTSWTRRQAVGAGQDWRNNCNPNCGEGTFVARKVRVIARRPRSGHFTQFVIRFQDNGKSYAANLHSADQPNFYWWG